MLLTLALACCSGNATASPKGSEAVIQLLQTQACNGCNLNEADLVHAQLDGVEITEASLKGANLNQAKLNASNLSNSDLSFVSLQGASLRGANLLGANLYGADLRGADLTNAKLSIGALSEAHWDGAMGIKTGIHSHAELHNAGVDAAQRGLWGEAETLFGRALEEAPTNGLTWVARGIARSQLVKDDLAASDWNYAASLFRSKGNSEWANQLETAARSIKKRRHQQSPRDNGNGIGSNILNGVISSLSSIAPLAIQALKYAGM